MSKYTEEVGRVATICKALSHPTRLKLLQAIARDRGSSPEPGRSPHVAELYALVDVSPSTVSHHLAELESAGLITERRVGTFRYLTLRPESAGLLRRFACSLDPTLAEPGLAEHAATPPQQHTDHG